MWASYYTNVIKPHFKIESKGISAEEQLTFYSLYI